MKNENIRIIDDPSPAKAERIRMAIRFLEPSLEVHNELRGEFHRHLKELIDLAKSWLSFDDFIRFTLKDFKYTVEGKYTVEEKKCSRPGCKHCDNGPDEHGFVMCLECALKPCDCPVLCSACLNKRSQMKGQE